MSVYKENQQDCKECRCRFSRLKVKLVFTELLLNTAGTFVWTKCLNCLRCSLNRSRKSAILQFRLYPWKVIWSTVKIFKVKLTHHLKYFELDQKWNSTQPKTNVRLCFVKLIHPVTDLENLARQTEERMHTSLSNSLFGNQADPYWRGAVGSPYSSLQPLSSMASNLPNTPYSPYEQYSSHHAVTSRQDKYQALNTYTHSYTNRITSISNNQTNKY